ncbi:hypothetical protein D9O40_05460, partial [Clostridium autoethanogenum]
NKKKKKKIKKKKIYLKILNLPQDLLIEKKKFKILVCFNSFFVWVVVFSKKKINHINFFKIKKLFS